MNRRRLVVAGVVVAGLAVSITAAAAANRGGGGLVKDVRKATKEFRDVEAATDAGYAQFLDCVDEPGEGAMGIHFVHGDRVGDIVLDPATPEALVYEPQADGSLELVAAELIVFQEAWDEANDHPPVVAGHHFHLVTVPNRYDLPAFYQLHVWAGRDNPSGDFNDWNPKVSCP